MNMHCLCGYFHVLKYSVKEIKLKISQGGWTTPKGGSIPPGGGARPYHKGGPRPYHQGGAPVSTLARETGSGVSAASTSEKLAAGGTFIKAANSRLANSRS